MTLKNLEPSTTLSCRIWPTYLQLLAATFASHARDPVLHKYVALVRDVQLAQGLDTLMHRVLQVRAALIRVDSLCMVWLCSQ